MSSGSVARWTGLAGAAAGLLAAGAAARVLAERKIVAKRRSQAEVAFGSLRSEPRSVVTDDMLELFAEVDEPPEDTAQPAAPTVLFVHGYALNLDSWHFQRAGLRDRFRLVFYDQRSHGRSGRSRPEHCTIDQLGRDLAAVVEQLVPDGPVVLVGHSMGGMTIMALAEQRPEWFGSRVAGVALLSTSAGELRGLVGMPGISGRVINLVSPAVIATLARSPRLVERGRRVGSDLGTVITRRFAFGGPVDQEYVDFTDQMLSGTPIDVVAEFLPVFAVHDKFSALAAFDAMPTLLACGTRDAITPVEHSRRMAEVLPNAELLELDGAGHMSMLERSEEVDAALVGLIEKASAR